MVLDTAGGQSGHGEHRHRALLGDVVLGRQGGSWRGQPPETNRITHTWIKTRDGWGIPRRHVHPTDSREMTDPATLVMGTGRLLNGLISSQRSRQPASASIAASASRLSRSRDSVRTARVFLRSCKLLDSCPTRRFRPAPSSPTARRADVVQRDVVVLAPEEGDRSEWPAGRTEHVARGRLTLALRGDEVLDADELAGAEVRIPGDVSGGENALCARLEVLVHQDSPVDPEPRLLRERGGGADANADDDEVGGQRPAARELDLAIADGGGRLAGVEDDPMLSWSSRTNSPASGPRIFSSGRASGVTTWTSRPRSRSEAATSSPMKPAPTTTTRGRAGAGDDRAAVGESPQVEDVRQRPSGDIEAHRLRSGGEEQRSEGDASFRRRD